MILAGLYKSEQHCLAEGWEPPSSFWVDAREIDKLAVEVMTRVGIPAEVQSLPVQQRVTRMKRLIMGGRIQINSSVLRVYGL